MPNRLLPPPPARTSTPVFWGTFPPDIAAGGLGATLQLKTDTLAITDGSSIMSQSAGQLVVNGAAAALSGGVAGTAVARTAGMAFLWGLRRSTTQGTSKAGLLNSSTLTNAIYAGFDLSSASAPRVNDSGGTMGLNEPGEGTQYSEMGVILRSTGFYLIMREEPGGCWTLAWVSNLGNTTVFPAISAGIATHNYAMKNARVVQLGGPWAQGDWGPAFAYSAATANGDTMAGLPFGIFEHTITAATGVTQEFSFRYVTDQDRWLIRLNQTTSAIQIIEVVSNVETVRGGGAATLTQTNGVQYRIVVVCRPNQASAGQDVITVCTQTGAAAPTGKDSYTGAATGRNVGTLKVSHAGANLACFPRGAPVPRWA